MTIISFNGKTYNSLEEMPADQRAAYEQVMSFMKDENNNGIPDMFEGDVIQKMMGMASTRIIVNGQEMQGMESMSPEARAKFDKAMQKLSQLGILPQGTPGHRPKLHSNPRLKLRRANPHSRNLLHLYNPLSVRDFGRYGTTLWHHHDCDSGCVFSMRLSHSWISAV